jgi:hypothetical protein
MDVLFFLKMTGKKWPKIELQGSTPWNAKNDDFLEHPLALSTSWIFDFFLRKILKNRPFLPLTILVKTGQILHDGFSGKSPIF